MEDLVILENEQAMTTSRTISEVFEKNHQHILEAIDNLTVENSTVKNMFKEETYKNGRGREYREVYMNRDGFTLLAMGFTGKKALEFKLQYIQAFNKMEQSLNELYHISETALTNNVVKELETKLFHRIDERLEQYEENYRPTHANKIKINNYIKSALGEDRQPHEADVVKNRVLMMLDAKSWQDVPYKELINNIHLIDQAIQAVRKFRQEQQLDLF